MRRQLPQLRTYFQSGGLVDAVLNQGMPAPIDVQVSGMDLKTGDAVAQNLARPNPESAGRLGCLYSARHGLSGACKLNVNRERASQLGLSPKEVVDNVITALTSDVMIAPSYWVDPKTGNNYFVSVQYPENQVKSIDDLKAMPLRSPNLKMPTYLSQVADVTQIQTPTEVDHYQLQRTFDVYVAPTGEDIGGPAKAISKIIADTQVPPNIRIDVRGLVVTMESSFKSFGLGLLLAILLVYLILVAQFASFIDPFLIVLAVPTGLVGVIFTLAFTGTTLNIQSLMGIVMLQGMVVSNSILIVDFANVLRSAGTQFSRGSGARMPHSASPYPDDFAGHRRRPSSHGFQTGNRQRSLRAAGARDHRRIDFIHHSHHLRGSSGIPSYLPAACGSKYGGSARGGALMSPRHFLLNLVVFALMAIPCTAQNSQSLSLAEAEKIAIQNHPQIQAAGYLAIAAQAQVTQARSAYYPQAVGSLTGVEAEHDSRIAAGALNNPIIYDRYSNGVTVGQLVTDFGRTHELVKSSSLHAQAQKENVTTSRADVLINVDRAYYSVLRSQAVLKVAEETVKESPAGVGSNYCLGKEQAEVRIGRELCERGLGGSATPADSGAKWSRGLLRGPLHGARVTPTKKHSCSRRSPFRRLRLRMFRNSYRKHCRIGPN